MIKHPTSRSIALLFTAAVANGSRGHGDQHRNTNAHTPAGGERHE